MVSILKRLQRWHGQQTWLLMYTKWQNNIIWLTLSFFFRKRFIKIFFTENWKWPDFDTNKRSRWFWLLFLSLFMLAIYQNYVSMMKIPKIHWEITYVLGMIRAFLLPTNSVKLIFYTPLNHRENRVFWKTRINPSCYCNIEPMHFDTRVMRFSKELGFLFIFNHLFEPVSHPSIK